MAKRRQDMSMTGDPTMNANKDPEIRKKKLHRRMEVMDSEIRILEERKAIMWHEILELGG